MFLSIWCGLKFFIHLQTLNGLVAQLNRVLDYGSRGSRFESWRGHQFIAALLKIWRLVDNYRCASPVHRFYKEVISSGLRSFNPSGNLRGKIISLNFKG